MMAVRILAMRSLLKERLEAAGSTHDWSVLQLLTTYYSLLTTHYSLLTTHYLLLTAYYSRITNSRTTTYH